MEYVGRSGDIRVSRAVVACRVILAEVVCFNLIVVSANTFLYHPGGFVS